MLDTRELYQQVILDHNRHPRNFRSIEGAEHHASGNNPLCGDTVSVDLTLEGDRIVDIAFQGAGCAISTASASMMTDLIKGSSVAEATVLFDQFRDLVRGSRDGTDQEALSVFSGIRDYPSRVKCATLAWHTMKAALEGTTDTITTE